MKIYLENVNIGSTTGPNYFGKKLVQYLQQFNCSFQTSDNGDHDIQLSFIESRNKTDSPIVQRLDGIYFNCNFDCNAMNSNIKKTYQNSDAVIFQTNFNKELIFSWFGEHQNYTIIRNGADMPYIASIPDLWSEMDNWENIWSCASNWHSYKRLSENIRYFLEHSSSRDCLIVAGSNPDHLIEHPRIFYVGNLPTDKLLSLFKKTKYFLHLAYLDHCPNVVVDAHASGCTVICSSSGGTKEVAGAGAIVLQEEPWDFSLIREKNPPKINFANRIKNTSSVGFEELSMSNISKKYYKFLKRNTRRK
jgi:glycosyltransferase involved in cell wall biosynthesis